MPRRELPHEKAGLGATLIALLAVMGAIVVLGIIIWMRRTPPKAPTEPSEAKPHSELRVPKIRSGIANLRFDATGNRRVA